MVWWGWRRVAIVSGLALDVRVFAPAHGGGDRGGQSPASVVIHIS